MCSISEMGSYLRRIDLVYHSLLGLRVIEKMERQYCRIIECFEEAEGPVDLVVFSFVGRFVVHWKHQHWYLHWWVGP